MCSENVATHRQDLERQKEGHVVHPGAGGWGPGLRRAREKSHVEAEVRGEGKIPAVRGCEMGAVAVDAAAQRKAIGDGPSKKQPVSGSPWRAPCGGHDVPLGAGREGESKNHVHGQYNCKTLISNKSLKPLN